MTIPQDKLIDSIAEDADVGYRCMANLPSFKRAVIDGIVYSAGHVAKKVYLNQFPFSRIFFHNSD